MLSKNLIVILYIFKSIILDTPCSGEFPVYTDQFYCSLSLLEINVRIFYLPFEILSTSAGFVPAIATSMCPRCV